MNNPIRFIDPDGMAVTDIEGGVRFDGEDALIAFEALKANFTRSEEEGGNKSAENANKPLWGSKPGFTVHQTANAFGIYRDGTPDLSKPDELKKYVNRIKALNDATVYADGDQFQTGEFSYRHGMRNNNETVEQARNKADQFVRSQLEKSKKMLEQGKEYEAYFQFGIALHVLQDATSPAHGGFQVWTGKESLLQQGNHVRKELVYPGGNSNLQKVTNMYLDWLQKSNVPLPTTNLFASIKTD